MYATPVMTAIPSVTYYINGLIELEWIPFAKLPYEME
jgi:hypothetical protein